jgi:hypothetical protein
MITITIKLDDQDEKKSKLFLEELKDKAEGIWDFEYQMMMLRELAEKHFPGQEMYLSTFEIEGLEINNQPETTITIVGPLEAEL